jgi:putative inorganic carbon (HCO3(-)) transporter
MIRRLLTRVTALELWILAAYGLAAAFFNVPPSLVLLLPALFWPARLLAGRPLHARSPADVAIRFLLVVVALSLFGVSRDPVSQVHAARLFYGVLLYYALLDWVQWRADLRWLVRGLAAITVGLGLFALISVEWDTSRFLFLPAQIYDRFQVLVGDAVHRNVMAGALLQLSLFPWIAALASWRRRMIWQFLPALALAVFVSGMLLLTQSRSAVLAFGISLLLVIGLAWLSSPRRAIIQLTVGLLAVLGLTIALAPSLTDYLFLGGIERRLAMWARGIYMMRDFPWSGVGFGLYQPTLNAFYPLFEVNPEISPHAHNIFIQIGVDLGLPGLIAWLGVYFLVLKSAWRLIVKGQSDDATLAWVLGLGLFAGQVGLAVHGLFDAVTWGMVRSAPLVWALWAAVMAASQGERSGHSA